MPSPFPGMDPYLEDPGFWPNVHLGLIFTLQEALNRQIRPRYFARVEERVYISHEADPGRQVMVPDLHLSVHPSHGAHAPMPGGGTGLEVAEPITAITLIEEEIRDAYLEILDREGNRVVTVIEVLSPANKVPGSRGLESFRQKRSDVLHSSSHWVEIDLLREGRSLEARKGLGPHEYMVHVSRAGRRPRGLLWPIRLPQRLPVVAIPLREGDPDVPLDLQAALTTVYDRAGYDVAIDYRSDPVPPLPPEWAEWADRRLREKGLR